jgi:hypothetical protein
VSTISKVRLVIAQKKGSVGETEEHHGLQKQDLIGPPGTLVGQMGPAPPAGHEEGISQAPGWVQ